MEAAALPHICSLPYINAEIYAFWWPDAAPHESLRGFGEGEAGEGGGESALSRREAASFAAVWNVTG